MDDGEDYLHEVQFKNQRNNAVNDNITSFYIETEKFNKVEDKLITNLDKWIYFIKNLEIVCF
ncbi:PD-(D/E)XK nuclease family transposase [Clostridium magnum DSM 2767]|uniref:PD-(D/E)XK nuclease family transposase n=1 Tax=Clostridium magnum DSM 2767 TaxID=1121326 RepID=A0A161WRN9_9CLOT|nr:PD-(D/E)XK nuclease family transposase [Clostridium magnum DSM 2767]